MKEELLKVYSNFLAEVSNAIADSDADPQVVYPLLEANLHRLDDNLPEILKRWAKDSIADSQSNDAYDIGTILLDLGILIEDFSQGDLANNIEIAISSYKIAEEILNFPKYPQEWGETRSNLGFAYLNRLKGNIAKNIETAISLSNDALNFITYKEFPEEWAEMQSNLAEAYRQRIEGDKGKNLELAITCYHNALKVYTLTDFPEEWSVFKNDLALTYHNRVKGDRADNLELAIDSVQQTFKIDNKEDYPEIWALSQNNLGFFYYQRIKRNRAENVKQALKHYQLALEVCSRDIYPEIWSLAQLNLGVAYLEGIEGDTAENIETAIEIFQELLDRFDPEKTPENWCKSQHNLGFAYYQKIEGDRKQNIEKAIKHYRLTLTRCTPDLFPDTWEMTKNKLGLAYLERVKGDNFNNWQIAFNTFQSVLQFRSRSEFPRQWAEIQNNLGFCFQNRKQGNQIENIEKATKYYQLAAKVYPREVNPKEWGLMQHNLGNIYSERKKFGRDNNIEKAIAHYQKASEVYTRDNFPEDWAVIQNDLANAYNNRLFGNKNENLKQAIHHYQAALEVHTQDSFPGNWAMLQNNLGNAYSQLLEGDEDENLEKAISYCQKALEVYKIQDFPEDWAMVQHNLGNIYSERTLGNEKENLATAIDYYHSALQIYTREDFPENWALSQNNLGLIYDYQGKIDKAIQSFKLALEIPKIYSSPGECLDYGENLGDVAFLARRWQEAIAGYEIAIATLEKFRVWTSDEDKRQDLLEEGIELYENIIQAYINNKQIDKAFEYVERSRCRQLVDLMVSNDLYSGGEISPEVQTYLQQYDAIQQQIDHERQRNNINLETKQNLVGTGASLQPSFVKPTRNRAATEAHNEKIITLEAEKQEIWQKIRSLDPVLAGEIQVSPSDLKSIQQLIDKPTTAILSFYATEEDTYIFVVRQNRINYHHCLQTEGDSLQTWIDRHWLTPYLEQKDSWKKQINSFLAELSQRLQLNNLVCEQLSDIEELIIVPYLNLHQIPFAGLPLSNNEYLGDKFLLRYVPSCQVLEFCYKRPRTNKKLTYGIVEDATEDLPCANFEGEFIAQLFGIPPERRLHGRDRATVNNYRQMIQQVQAIVSSHHAQSRLDNPLESKLILGDGSITLGQLMTPGWRLPQLTEVFLSCCETGLGVSEIVDDIFTISTGFLCAGARSVISTLWSVDDLATALFSIFYHHFRQERLSRPAAIHEAQIKLRTLTGKTLLTEYQSKLIPLLDRQFQQAETKRKQAKTNRNQETKDSPGYLHWQEKYKQYYQTAQHIRTVKQTFNYLSQQNFPFQHPFYWAAFICSGLD